MRLIIFDEIAPEAVVNFLQYVEGGAYTNSFVHRLMPGFVIQGGGFVYDQDAEEDNVIPISARTAVVNEPYLSDVRGTIAMAKVGNDPNSATSQWFFNLNDNSDPDNPLNLDWQNGGFTAFGQVSEGAWPFWMLWRICICLIWVSTPRLGDYPCGI